MNRPQVVEELLAHPEVDVNVGPEEDLSPLYIAATMGHGQVAKLILSHPSVDIGKGPNGDTPLSVASEMGHREAQDSFYLVVLLTNVTHLGAIQSRGHQQVVR